MSTHLLLFPPQGLNSLKGGGTITGNLSLEGALTFSGTAWPEDPLAASLFLAAPTVASNGFFIDNDGNYVGATPAFGVAEQDGNDEYYGLYRRRVKTLSSGALSGATHTYSNFFPAGVRILGVTIAVRTTVTGATSFDVGDGSDVDRWGATIGLSSGTKTDETDWTADPASWSSSAVSVVLTANGSNFSGGNVVIFGAYEEMASRTI